MANSLVDKFDAGEAHWYSIVFPISGESLRFLKMPSSSANKILEIDTREVTMKEARVSFKTRHGGKRAQLSIDGVLIADNVSILDVAKLLRGAQSESVRLDDGFIFFLPADSCALSAAADAQLAQPLETFYLIAECSWSEEGGEHAHDDDVS